MKLTNGEIFRAKEPLAKLMVQKFPVRVAYGLAMLTNKLGSQLKVIDDVRNGLIKTYGKPDPDNPRQIKVLPDSEGFDKFVEEMSELLSQEVEVVFDKVKLPEKVAATCDKCNHNMDKPLELEPWILVALSKFIDIKEV